ncbi:hypothetical protein [Riemerella columbina]|nr:hypothetical protein [Riemerella columbina]WKS94807.1 hypothetical protein NYR17_07705 [Riemerella columbina]
MLFQLSKRDFAESSAVKFAILGYTKVNFSSATRWALFKKRLFLPLD